MTENTFNRKLLIKTANSCKNSSAVKQTTSIQDHQKRNMRKKLLNQSLITSHKHTF